MITFSNKKIPDAGAVFALSQYAAWAQKRNLAGICKMLKHTDLIMTAWDKKRLVGMTRCTTDYTYRAVLWDVIVDPRYHRQGIGSRLVQMVLKHASLKSVNQFWLYTGDKQNFYKRFGFQLYPGNMMVLKK